MTFPSHLITRDRVAVALERQIIRRYTRAAKTVLDVGCGTGDTLRWLAEQGAGQSLIGVEPLHPCVSTSFTGAVYDYGIFQGDHTTITGRYDAIYTQRMLIQLSCWAAQREAIQHLRGHLTPGGVLVCVEPALAGLGRLNALRLDVGLPAIVPPAHTQYLPPIESGEGLVVQGYFGQVYSLLSRVVEAYRAQQEGREPAYMNPESAEGQLCQMLSNTGEVFGQYHYSVWGPA